MECVHVHILLTMYRPYRLQVMVEIQFVLGQHSQDETALFTELQIGIVFILTVYTNDLLYTGQTYNNNAT